MDKKRKKILITAIIFILLIIIRLRVYDLYSTNIMASFKLQLYDGTFIDNRDISGFRTSFIFIKKINAISNSIIKDVINNKTDLDKIIIINNDFKSNFIEAPIENVFIVKPSRQYLAKKLKFLNQNFNSIIIYNSKSELELYLPLKGKNKTKINMSYRNLKEELLKGNIQGLYSNIKKVMSNYENGYYYFTEILYSSCLCFRIYQDIENICYQKGNKLKLVLIGDWTHIEIENILKERNYRVIVERADEDINQNVRDWKNETHRKNFNLVVVKSNDILLTFPILDRIDYKIWNNFKEQSNLVLK
jgi:hypothetical protein